MTTVIEVVGPAVGGIRQHVTELVRQARSAGIEIVIAGPSAPRGVEADVAIPLAGASRPWGVVRAATTIAGLPGDVVHAHGMTAGWAAVLARVRRARRSGPRRETGDRRPLVLTAHNVVLGRSPLRALEGALYRRCDVVIAPSAEIADRIRRTAPAVDVHEIVPTFPSPSPRRSRSEVRTGLGVGDEVTLVVVPARMHPQKDHETVVRAIAALDATAQPVVALLVGDGPTRRSVEALVEELGQTERLRLLGHRDDVADLVAAADVVLVGSTWEAVPLVVLEAMTLGVAVISSNVGIVGELVDAEGPVVRIVPVGDVLAMAAALRELVSSPASRTSLAHRGAEVALRYSPRSLGTAVLAVYAGLVA